MNVVVFGGGEAVVDSLVRAALDEGHVVTLAVGVGVSSPRVEDPRGPHGARLVRADVFSGRSLDDALHSQDAVLFAVGAAAARAAAAPLAHAVRNVIEIMGAHGVRRLVCVSDGAADPERRRSFFGRLFGGADPAHADELRRMEVAVRASDLEWVIVRPARLVDAPARGVYREGPGYTLPGGSRIARDDAATFLVRQLTSRQYVGHAVALAW